MKAAVIYHKADYDGLFSGDTCRFFLEQRGHEVTMFPYDYGEPDPIPKDQRWLFDKIYIVDVSLDEHLLEPSKDVVWIDHHGTAIANYPSSVKGLRIDGVAACRLCWQWFLLELENGKSYVAGPDFYTRQVSEPEIVRLAGEYDVWDKRDPRAELLQYGMKAMEFSLYQRLDYWRDHDPKAIDFGLEQLLSAGESARRYADAVNKDVLDKYGQKIRVFGMTFLAMNWPARSSLAFEANITDDVQALMSYFWTGNKFRVSLYGHSKADPNLDLSRIAKVFGGGGHKQACGFQCDMETMGSILKGEYIGIKP